MERKRESQAQGVNNGGEEIAQELAKRLGFIWGRSPLNRGSENMTVVLFYVQPKRKRRGKQAGRPGSRPRPVGRPGLHPSGPAWEPAQAGREAGGPPEWTAQGTGQGRQGGRGDGRMSRPGSRPRPAVSPAAHFSFFPSNILSKKTSNSKTAIIFTPELRSR